jgi:hypothetical protein
MTGRASQTVVQSNPSVFCDSRDYTNVAWLVGIMLAVVVAFPLCLIGLFILQAYNKSIRISSEQWCVGGRPRAPRRIFFSCRGGPPSSRARRLLPIVGPFLDPQNKARRFTPMRYVAAIQYLRRLILVRRACPVAY